MSKEKYNVKIIPQKQLGEDPASENQLGYLRMLTDLTEADLKFLGKWQASTIIDAATAFRDSQSEVSAKRPKAKSRGIGKIVILIALIFGGWKGYSIINRISTESKVASSNPSERIETPAKTPASIRNPDSIAKNPAELTKTKGTPAASGNGTLANLEGVSLPVQLTTTEEITLRNSTGKEVSLPAETNIKVNTRSEHGTLSMAINGDLFVGNESRLSGKVKQKQ